MEELKSKINEWIQFSSDLVAHDKVIENFLSELEQQIPEVSLDKTPKQPKKKRNVPSMLTDNVEIAESTNPTEDKSISKTSLNAKDLSGQQSERPSRAAKDKACANLKEIPINLKMRNDIKNERISINMSLRQAGPSNILIGEHNDDKTDKTDSCEDKEKVVQSQSEGDEIRLSNNKKVKLSSQANSSLELLPPVDVKIELLSDDEKDKMPPPSQPPIKTKKKAKGTTTKASNSSVVDKIIPASEIKQEKSESSSTITAPATSNTRPKRTKGKGRTNTIDNSKSQEKSSDEIDQNHIKEQTEIEKPNTVRKELVPMLNATFESVYEDAISDSAKTSDVNNTNSNENNSNENIKNVSVLLKKLTNSEIEALKIPTPKPENVNNETFNVTVTRTNDPGETFVAEQETNSTFVMAKINETVEIKAHHKEGGLQSSLITDDESESEEIIKKIKKTGKNEIFNPLIQSPVRKKVQAFEQHAAKNLNILGSPAPTRSARIKSRIQDIKANRDTSTPISRIPKPETPNTDPKPHRYLTPKETSSSSLVAVNIKPKYNSTSKLQSSSSGGGSKSSTSRENSVEDLKRGAHAIQMAAEEKKRKREEKQKHAQQVREAKEREKREAAERVAREKQEKCKKLLQEREEKARQEFEKKKVLREHKLHKADLQKNLEEIQRNLQIPKHLEQKRDESILYEMQKKKLADKERDLREVARIAAIRDEINRNLSSHVQEAGMSKKPKQKQYDFDLLLSGDSTDEEDKQTTKKPPPPTWSLSKVRQPVIREQSYVQWKVVDKLFSVQPMTIDLQEIFPTIDSRYLKRNSSVIWSTPPRYSEIPKY